MPAYLADYGADFFIQALFSKVTTPPSSYWLALCSDVPDASNDGSSMAEVAAASYSRMQVTNNSTNWLSTSNGIVSLGTTITFPTPAQDWGTVVAYAFMDTGTVGAGNIYTFGTLSAARYVAAGALVRFLPGDINFGLTSLPEQIIA